MTTIDEMKEQRDKVRGYLIEAVQQNDKTDIDFWAMRLTFWNDTIKAATGEKR